MKKKVSVNSAHRLINHGPVVLISTYYKGRPNVLPVAWVMPVDYRPCRAAFVVSSSHYSYECLTKTGECVINVPNKAMAEKVLACGRTSGRQVDKFKRFGLTPIKAKTVKAPLIKECIGHIECKLVKEPYLLKEYEMFIGKAGYAWAEKGLFDGLWLTDKPAAQTLHHLGGDNFAALGRWRKKINL